MGDVAGHHEAEGKHSEGVAAGHAAPRPGVPLQVAKEVDAGASGYAELFDVGDPPTLIRPPRRRQRCSDRSWEAAVSGPVCRLRANQRARITKTRSVSFRWLRTWRMVHLSGA